MSAVACVKCSCRPEDVDYHALSADIILDGGANLKPEDLRL